MSEWSTWAREVFLKLLERHYNIPQTIEYMKQIKAELCYKSPATIEAVKEEQ